MNSSRLIAISNTSLITIMRKFTNKIYCFSHFHIMHERIPTKRTLKAGQGQNLVVVYKLHFIHRLVMDENVKYVNFNLLSGKQIRAKNRRS